VSGGPEVILDPGAAYPEFAPVRAAMQARDWPAVRHLLDATPPGLRSGIIHTCGEEQKDPEFLTAVVQADPNDTTAAAMLGAHLVVVGWRIRTAASADQVSRRQFAKFHEWLRQAEAVLLEASVVNPRDPAVWHELLLSGRGLQVGQSEVLRRYDRCKLADPHHLPAQQSMVQQLCPKWGGSWELVHSFAREAMLAAPPGFPQAGLVVDAHIEHGYTGVKHEALTASAFRKYLQQEPVRAELYDAAHRSVWNPEFRRWYGWEWTASSFAMVFSLLGDDRGAQHLFGLLGNIATTQPWEYLGVPTWQIRKYRKKAGAWR
jgi:hypothetical protein